RDVALPRPAQHAWPQPPPLERLEVRAHRRLAAGAAGDVAERPGLEDFLRLRLPVVRPDRPGGLARNVDRVLDGRAVDPGHDAILRRSTLRLERHGPGGPAGLQNQCGVVAPRSVGSTPAPLRNSP